MLPSPGGNCTFTRVSIITRLSFVYGLVPFRYLVVCTVELILTSNDHDSFVQPPTAYPVGKIRHPNAP
jgi:hypothetical protein